MKSIEKNFGKVAVLYGGTSSERDISLISGQAVYEALKSRNIDAHLIDTKNHDAVINLKQGNFDRAFVMLHGRGGEDGQIQGVLEWLNIPYTGSGITACACAMDKMLCKAIWKAKGLPVLPDKEIQINDSYEQVSLELSADVLAIKPALEGSSVGISCVKSQEDWENALKKAKIAEQKVMAEVWITGREITSAIVNKDILPAIEIITSSQHQFYDFDAKYKDDATKYVCPAPIDENLANKIAKITEKAFEAIGATGWGRADFIVDKQNQPWILEVNLAPGMTSHSLVPQAAAKAGMSFADLVLKVLETSNNRELT